MFIFLGFLAVGLLYAYKKGVLDMDVTPTPAEPVRLPEPLLRSRSGWARSPGWPPSR